MSLVRSLKGLNGLFTAEYVSTLRSTTRILHQVGLERRYGDMLGVCVTYLVSERNHRTLDMTTVRHVIYDRDEGEGEQEGKQEGREGNRER